MIATASWSAVCRGRVLDRVLERDHSDSRTTAWVHQCERDHRSTMWCRLRVASRAMTREFLIPAAERGEPGLTTGRLWGAGRARACLHPGPAAHIAGNRLVLPTSMGLAETKPGTPVASPNGAMIQRGMVVFVGMVTATLG